MSQFITYRLQEM